MPSNVGEVIAPVNGFGGYFLGLGIAPCYMSRMPSKLPQVIIRTAPEDIAEWKKAAAEDGLSLAAWLRRLANHRARQARRKLAPVATTQNAGRP